MNLFERATAKLDTINPVASRGIVTDLTGLIIEANGPSVGIGATCSIVQGDVRLSAQVVGFKRDRILLMPFGDLMASVPERL